MTKQATSMTPEMETIDDMNQALKHLGWESADDLHSFAVHNDIERFEQLTQAFTRHRLASTAALQAERDALAARVTALEGVIVRINHAGAALAAHPDCTAKKAKPCPAQRATVEFIAAVALAVKSEKNP